MEVKSIIVKRTECQTKIFITRYHTDLSLCCEPKANRLNEFSLNVFTEFSDKIFITIVKGLEPATSCFRDQDATTVPARHM